MHQSLLLYRRSIDLSGAREKEGHFHYKNFLRASKWGITSHTCSIIPKSLYCGLGLIPLLVHHWGRLTSDLRVVIKDMFCMPGNEAVVFFARDLSAANLHFKLALKGPFELSYESWLVVAVVVIVELEVVEADGPVDVFQSPTDLDGEVFRFFRWHRSRQTRKGWGSSWCKVMGARTLGGNRKGNRHLIARVLAPSFELKSTKCVSCFCWLIGCF